MIFLLGVWVELLLEVDEVVVLFFGYVFVVWEWLVLEDLCD